MTQLMTTVFLDQPLVLPGSANYSVKQGIYTTENHLQTYETGKVVLYFGLL